MINVTTMHILFTVDKIKAKSSARQHQQQCSQPAKSAGSRTAVQGSVLQDDQRDQNIQQLKKLLTASDCRFQALAIVLQQTLAEVKLCIIIFFFNYTLLVKLCNVDISGR